MICNESGVFEKEEVFSFVRKQFLDTPIHDVLLSEKMKQGLRTFELDIVRYVCFLMHRGYECSYVKRILKNVYPKDVWRMLCLEHLSDYLNEEKVFYFYCMHVLNDSVVDAVYADKYFDNFFKYAEYHKPYIPVFGESYVRRMMELLRKKGISNASEYVSIEDVFKCYSSVEELKNWMPCFKGKAFSSGYPEDLEPGIVFDAVGWSEIPSFFASKKNKKTKRWLKELILYVVGSAKSDSEKSTLLTEVYGCLSVELKVFFLSHLLEHNEEMFGVVSQVVSSDIFNSEKHRLSVGVMLKHPSFRDRLCACIVRASAEEEAFVRDSFLLLEEHGFSVLGMDVSLQEKYFEIFGDSLIYADHEKYETFWRGVDLSLLVHKRDTDLQRIFLMPDAVERTQKLLEYIDSGGVLNRYRKDIVRCLMPFIAHEGVFEKIYFLCHCDGYFEDDEEILGLSSLFQEHVCRSLERRLADDKKDLSFGWWKIVCGGGFLQSMTEVQRYNACLCVALCVFKDSEKKYLWREISRVEQGLGFSGENLSAHRLMLDYGGFYKEKIMHESATQFYAVMCEESLRRTETIKRRQHRMASVSERWMSATQYKIETTEEPSYSVPKEYKHAFAALDTQRLLSNPIARVAEDVWELLGSVCADPSYVPDVCKEKGSALIDGKMEGVLPNIGKGLFDETVPVLYHMVLLIQKGTLNLATVPPSFLAFLDNIDNALMKPTKSMSFKQRMFFDFFRRNIFLALYEKVPEESVYRQNFVDRHVVFAQNDLSKQCVPEFLRRYGLRDVVQKLTKDVDVTVFAKVAPRLSTACFSGETEDGEALIAAVHRFSELVAEQVSGIPGVNFYALRAVFFKKMVQSGVWVEVDPSSEVKAAYETFVCRHIEELTASFLEPTVGRFFDENVSAFESIMFLPALIDLSGQFSDAVKYRDLYISFMSRFVGFFVGSPTVSQRKKEILYVLMASQSMFLASHKEASMRSLGVQLHRMLVHSVCAMLAGEDFFHFASMYRNAMGRLDHKQKSAFFKNEENVFLFLQLRKHFESLFESIPVDKILKDAMREDFNDAMTVMRVSQSELMIAFFLPIDVRVRREAVKVFFGDPANVVQAFKYLNRILIPEFFDPETVKKMMPMLNAFLQYFVETWDKVPEYLEIEELKENKALSTVRLRIDKKKREAGASAGAGTA